MEFWEADVFYDIHLCERMQQFEHKLHVIVGRYITLYHEKLFWDEMAESQRCALIEPFDFKVPFLFEGLFVNSIGRDADFTPDHSDIYISYSQLETVHHKPPATNFFFWCSQAAEQRRRHMQQSSLSLPPWAHDLRLLKLSQCKPCMVL